MKSLPFGVWLKTAFKIGWKPREFWSATISEFMAAIDAFNEMQGGPAKPEAPTDDEMRDLLAKYG